MTSDPTILPEMALLQHIAQRPTGVYCGEFPTQDYKTLLQAGLIQFRPGSKVMVIVTEKGFGAIARAKS